MITSPEPLPFMTVEEYLEWEPRQDVRYEYANSEVLAMIGGTIPHNDIALNLYTALRPHLRSRGCRINVADVKVQISPVSPYYYPDVIVSCDPRALNAHQFIQFPVLIGEVLSPGSEAKDRGEKFRNYQTLPSLQEYALKKNPSRNAGMIAIDRNSNPPIAVLRKDVSSPTRYTGPLSCQPIDRLPDPISTFSEL